MKKAIVITLLFLTCSICSAALPPRYQNEKDLDVLIDFIKSHERILSSLESIDFKHYTIYYRPHCKVVFGRKQVQRAPGWVGPAAPLEFKSSTCEVD